MVTQRTEGLYRVFLLCQILIIAALFWLGVWIMVTFYSASGVPTGADTASTAECLSWA
jgi:hypothetical protein